MNLHLPATVFLCLAALASCKTASRDPLAPLPPSYVNFDPPKGDPTKVLDWRRYGPGAIIRTSGQSQYINAGLVIGDAAVAGLADKAQWTPVELAYGSDDRQTMLKGAAQYTYHSLVSAGLGAQTNNQKNFTYEFGTAYGAEVPEGELLATLLKNRDVIDSDLSWLLKNGQCKVIQGVLIVDSMKVTIKDSQNHSVDLNAQLTAQQKASLEGQNAHVNSSEITFSQPRFVAYRPLLADQLKRQKIVQ